MGEQGAERRHAEQVAADAVEHAFAIISAATFRLPQVVELISELSETEAKLVVSYLAKWNAAILHGIAERDGRDISAVLPELMARARKR